MRSGVDLQSISKPMRKDTSNAIAFDRENWPRTTSQPLQRYPSSPAAQPRKLSLMCLRVTYGVFQMQKSSTVSRAGGNLGSLALASAHSTK